ncbi:acylphosphatase [Candidatus Woesearchaeota archaeon]|nr:acylphosphatase [Candidatus Woesearchaeota archaeon]
MKRIHLIISGKVQGVFFRHNASLTANRLGLKGFVRNLPDGNVEVVAEGSEERLKELIRFCREGPKGAYVDNVEIAYEDPKGEFKTFSVRY